MEAIMVNIRCNICIGRVRSKDFKPRASPDRHVIPGKTVK
jgi:hypothetical protein